jgi:hypothetical protein
MFRIVFTFILGLAAGSWAIPAVNAQFRNVATTRLMTMDLAGWCEGKEATVELYEAGAGTSGNHYHPAHSFTYILQGSEERVLEGKPVETFNVGNVLHEEPEVHTSTNKSTVKLLTFRIAEKGKPACVREGGSSC